MILILIWIKSTVSIIISIITWWFICILSKTALEFLLPVILGVFWQSTPHSIEQITHNGKCDCKYDETHEQNASILHIPALNASFWNRLGDMCHDWLSFGTDSSSASRLRSYAECFSRWEAKGLHVCACCHLNKIWIIIDVLLMWASHLLELICWDLLNWLLWLSSQLLLDPEHCCQVCSVSSFAIDWLWLWPSCLLDTQQVLRICDICSLCSFES